MTKEPRACETCARPYVPLRPWARFCSPACRYAGWASGKRQGTNAGQVEGKVGLGEIVAPEPANSLESYNAQLWLTALETLRARVAALEALPVRYHGLAVTTPSDPATWKHGANCYRNHGCRCETCVAGMRTARLSRRQKA